MADRQRDNKQRGSGIKMDPQEFDRASQAQNITLEELEDILNKPMKFDIYRGPLPTTPDGPLLNAKEVVFDTAMMRNIMGPIETFAANQ